MIKIVTIIGARPQIIKAAALSRAIRNKFSTKVHEIIVHTGQHYDERMSSVFFEELSIPQPNYNLNVGSASHGKQTAMMISGIEDVLEKEDPDFLVVYGDTNSTLAGAIAASKMHIPIVHIEAGLRSFNRRMPEEVNRILCDHVSTLLFSPTKAGYLNLIQEGFKVDAGPIINADHPQIYHCGDVMYDNSLHFAALADEKTAILEQLQLKKKNYLLTTIHRDSNTDDPKRLSSILSALIEIAESKSIDIVLPLHPRTSNILAKSIDSGLYQRIVNSNRIKLIQPVSFLEMTQLEKNSRLVITDSGGVQKESYFFNVPCVILREQTEWVELVECGAAKLADANHEKIIDAVNYYLSENSIHYPPIFGDGHAAEFICAELIKISKTLAETKAVKK